MATVLFAFTYDTETKKATTTGNISALKALQLLQRVLIDAARMGQEDPKPKEQEVPNATED